MDAVKVQVESAEVREKELAPGRVMGAVVKAWVDTE